MDKIYMLIQILIWSIIIFQVVYYGVPLFMQTKKLDELMNKVKNKQDLVDIGVIDYNVQLKIKDEYTNELNNILNMYNLDTRRKVNFACFIVVLILCAAGLIIKFNYLV